MIVPRRSQRTTARRFHLETRTCAPPFKADALLAPSSRIQSPASSMNNFIIERSLVPTTRKVAQVATTHVFYLILLHQKMETRLHCLRKSRYLKWNAILATILVCSRMGASFNKLAGNES